MCTRSNVSGIVLAGGASRRLGRNKAVERVGCEPLLLRVIGRLSQITDDVIVVAANEDQGSTLPLTGPTRVVNDIYPGSGSLGGIFTGLTRAECQWAVVVACDMPFLNPELLRHILSLRDGHDVVVPVLDGRPETTHAIYAKTCLPHIQRRLQSGDFKIARLFDEVSVCYVPQQTIEQRDPQHLSFFNVNTEEDLQRALALAEQGN